MSTLPPDQIHVEVQERYGRIATEFKPEVSASCCTPSASTICCSVDVDEVALFADLYTADTKWLPEDVTGLSLGCGDPITLAGLEPGQTVLDLGSGGGIDCFMAARNVGSAGYVIGIDMTPAMLEKANRNKTKVGLDNVEFRQGQIEALPVTDDTIDVIISNCVINLSPDKTAVFQEAYRVLKPGGRLAVSDIVTRGQFGPEDRANMAAWSECVTGAEDVNMLVSKMQAAGFNQISIRDKNDPDVELATAAPHHGSVEVVSARITAVK